jgi:hypothetical protein
LGKALAVKVAEVQNMARHVLRAALESAVQVGRGNEGNRHAEMANPTKCRDSLQPLSPRCTGAAARCGCQGSALIGRASRARRRRQQASGNGQSYEM